jgi:hypothetical protein
MEGMELVLAVDERRVRICGRNWRKFWRGELEGEAESEGDDEAEERVGEEL